MMKTSEHSPSPPSPPDRVRAVLIGGDGESLVDACRRAGIEVVGFGDVASARSDRLVIRDGARSLVLRPTTISWIEAAGNYVRIHGDQNHRLVRSTLAQIEANLDPHQFARIHRGTLVNLDRVVMVEPVGRGLVAVLREGTRLAISRSCRSSFSALLAGA